MFLQIALLSAIHLYKLNLNYMKKIIFVITYLVIFSTVRGQSDPQRYIPMIGDHVPTFEAKSTMGEIKFPADYFSKWKIIFSHPGDFTPVCSSEILALAASAKEFEALNTVILVISADGLNSHMEWVKSLEQINWKNKGIQKITFPLIADVGLDISKKFGMVHPKVSSTKDIRGVFIIDNENKIRSIFYYPNTTGRNIDEIKRTLIALQTSDSKYVLTPADWRPGDDVLIDSPSSLAEAQKLSEKKSDNLYSLAWYLWFKKFNK